MKRHILITSLLAANLFTAGCVSTPTPPMSLSEELKYSASLQQKYTADEEWWKQYKNTELNRLVKTALVNNPDYLKAALNINKELYNLNLASSDLFPTLSAGLGASSQRQIDTHDNYSNNFSGELGVSYEIDLYGKIRDLQTAQEFEYKATIMDKDAAKLSLVNSVVDLYFNLEYLQNPISMPSQNIGTFGNVKKNSRGKI